MKNPKKIEPGLWWVQNVTIAHLTSGRWRVVASSVPAEDVITGTISETVYAPGTCKTEHHASCWASHSKAWERLRLHSQGAALLHKIKANFPEQECRKEIFGPLCRRLNAEFENGWLYKNQDAQDIIARVVLGETSSRNVAGNFPKIFPNPPGWADDPVNLSRQSLNP